MNKFSQGSLDKLETSHKFLQVLAHEVLQDMDITIIYGHRDEKEQNKLFEQGASKVKYPNSKHNSDPSIAIDVVPYPSAWASSEAEFTRMRELFFWHAGKLGIKLKEMIIFNGGGGDYAHIELAL